MSDEYSVGEVRAVAMNMEADDTFKCSAEDCQLASDMLTAYANRIEADESAVPMATVVVRDEGGFPYIERIDHDMLPGTIQLFTHPPAQTPVIVPPYVSADDANRLYGEAFGVDWKYETAPAHAAQVLAPEGGEVE